jgi:hypothetical protein
MGEGGWHERKAGVPMRDSVAFAARRNDEAAIFLKYPKT